MGIAEVADRMEKTYVHTWSWVNYPLVASTGANLVAFSSGIGDGSYPTWWELDAQGQIAGLITDFGLLEDATRASGGGKSWWQFWK